MTLSEWPKRPMYWYGDEAMYVSVPFTWDLPKVLRAIEEDLFNYKWWVGGPAVELMPDYFPRSSRLMVGGSLPGVLQQINPQATRTTIGCIRRCKFCAVSKIEPSFHELDDWPDLPVVCDNNLLAASEKHVDRVMDRLAVHGECDFSQGLDCRLLTDHHAKRLAEIKKPLIRLALDDDSVAVQFMHAYDRLRAAGVAKKRIRAYVLVGFQDGVREAWARCEYVESFGVMPLPMWFHALDAQVFNGVSKEQRTLGWTQYERKRLFGYYYQHRGQKPPEHAAVDKEKE